MKLLVAGSKQASWIPASAMRDLIVYMIYVCRPCKKKIRCRDGGCVFGDHPCPVCIPPFLHLVCMVFGTAIPTSPFICGNVFMDLFVCIFCVYRGITLIMYIYWTNFISKLLS